MKTKILIALTGMFIFFNINVYGYADTKPGNRLYHRKLYRIAETGPVYIYTRQKEQVEYRSHIRVIYTYYFSTTPDDDIEELNADNLKRRYNDPKFLNSILDGRDITAYDSAQHTFMINEVYLNAQQ